MPTSTSQSSRLSESSRLTSQKPLWRSQSRSRWGLPVLLLLLGLGGIGLNLWHETATKRSQQQIITQPVERKTIPVILTGNGTVNAERSINLSPKTAGVIKSLLVEESDRVQKGQTIAIMDDSNLLGDITQMRGQLAEKKARLQELEAGNRPQDIAQAEAKLHENRATLQQKEMDLGRYQRLYSQGAVSRGDLDQKLTDRDVAKNQVAEAEQSLALQNAGTRSEVVDQARAQVQNALGSLQKVQAQLNDTRVVAPFDGIVIKKYADVGAFVSPSMAGGALESASSSSILTLSSRRLQVVVNLSESQIAKVKLGQSVTIKADAFAQEVFTGKVDKIAAKATVSQNVTSFEVRVAILSPSAEKFKAGMNVEAQFKVGDLDNAMLIPNAAVVRKPEGEGVFILGSDRQPVFQPIHTGITAGNKTEVKSGLQGHEQILVSPPSTESSGSGGFSLLPKAPAQ
jgi:HlyD family secretion protein